MGKRYSPEPQNRTENIVSSIRSAPILIEKIFSVFVYLQAQSVKRSESSNIYSRSGCKLDRIARFHTEDVDRPPLIGGHFDQPIGIIIPEKPHFGYT